MYNQALDEGKEQIEMRKIQVLLLALFAMFALTSVAASVASAEHQWLDLEGKLLSVAHETLTNGFILLHHEPPAILGGGSILIECTGSFHGTVGPDSEDLVKLVLGLVSTENDLVKCEVTSSTNGICPAHEKVEVHPIHLPWGTKLLLFNSITYNHIFADGKGEPGYETVCKSIKTSCEGLDRAKWDENELGGSLFLFLGEITNSCSDGGKGTVLGHGLVEDYFVS